jgi:hypothetical protein
MSETIEDDFILYLSADEFDDDEDDYEELEPREVDSALVCQCGKPATMFLIGNMNEVAICLECAYPKENQSLEAVFGHNEQIIWLDTD